MSRQLFFLFFFLSTLAICLFSLEAVASDVADKARAEELKQLKKKIKKVQQSLSSAKKQRRQVNSRLQDTERRIGESARRLREIEGNLKKQAAQLARLHREQQQEENQLSEHRAALEQQVKAAYAIGRQERVKILLNQQDPALLSRVMIYYDYFNKARSERMSLIGQQLEQLELIEQRIKQEESRLISLRKYEEAEREKLVAARSEREQAIAALNKEISGKNQQMQTLQQDAEYLQELLTGLQQALADISRDVKDDKPFKSRRGNLPWPAKGRLAARFGSVKNVGNLRWDGVLISAAEGGEVKAIHRGRVAFADWLRGFGLLLIIDHGDGYMTLYGHNQSLFKETGEWVEPGEVVALVGNSGGQSNSGVYFGIRYNGKPVNPRKWCQRSRGNRVGKVVPLMNPSDSMVSLYHSTTG